MAHKTTQDKYIRTKPHITYYRPPSTQTEAEAEALLALPPLIALEPAAARLLYGDVPEPTAAAVAAARGATDDDVDTEEKLGGEKAETATAAAAAPAAGAVQSTGKAGAADTPAAADKGANDLAETGTQAEARATVAAANKAAGAGAGPEGSQPPPPARPAPHRRPALLLKAFSGPFLRSLGARAAMLRSLIPEEKRPSYESPKVHLRGADAYISRRVRRFLFVFLLFMHIPFFCSSLFSPFSPFSCLTSSIFAFFSFWSRKTKQPVLLKRSLNDLPNEPMRSAGTRSLSPTRPTSAPCAPTRASRPSSARPSARHSSRGRRGTTPRQRQPQPQRQSQARARRE